jgi:hypothetical protein
MSMHGRGRSATGWLLLSGLLAVSLFPAAPVARAAMAGANPITTSNRADLRSVQRVGSNQARFCFDRALANQPFSPGSFQLGGYRVGTFLAGSGTTLDTDPSCVLVGFPPADLASYSFGQVAGGAVTPSAPGSAPNLADSTANLGSTSHSGTTGHTVGPDLVGVSPDQAFPNQLIYSFDQPVDPTTVGAASGFGFYDPDGGRHNATAVTGVDNLGNVRVAFSTLDSSAGSPVRVVVDKGTVFASTPNPEKGNPDWSAVIPATTGSTARPDLVSAALVFGPGNQPTNQVDYGFNKAIAAIPSPASFRVFYSDATFDEGVSAAVVGGAGGNVVRVAFPAGVASIQEEMVVASVLQNAADSPQGNGNTAGGAPVGDNGGAFATGFSNGPDAFGVTFDTGTGAVVVTFDQRVDPATISPGGFRLLDGHGDVVASGATSVGVGQTAVPGPTQVALQFTPQQVSAAGALEIQGPLTAGATVRTFPGAIGNVEQLVAPTASAAAFAPPARRRTRSRWIRPRRNRARRAAVLRASRRPRHGRGRAQRAPGLASRARRAKLIPQAPRPRP